MKLKVRIERGLVASWQLYTRRQALILLKHHMCMLVPPNVRDKLATTAWRTGQQAQNGPQAQRLMAGVPRRWGSA
jgi:hypothetical protein